MIKFKSFNDLAAADDGRLEARHGSSFGHCWDVEQMTGALKTCLAITLRGVLVTIAAMGIAVIPASYALAHIRLRGGPLAMH